MKNSYYSIILLFLLMILISSPIHCQEEKKSWVEKNIEISGYVKYLNTTSAISWDEIFSDNLIHNRINLKAFITDELEFDLQVRNRAMWGTSVTFNPFYKFSIDSDEKAIDLSHFLIDKKAFLLHSEIDRLKLSYTKGAWDFVLGRQRVNWGKNLIWNPNDLFNAYNFIDVDYTERPGSDAVNVRYTAKNQSFIQVVYSYGKEWNESILALRYQFYYKKYDIQILAANYNEDIAIGTGWEGYIKDAGFKGEMTYFTPKSGFGNKTSVLTASLSLDYFFKNGISIVGGFLYNNKGIDTLSTIDLTAFSTSKLSAKNLMPNRWSTFTQISYPFNAALNGSTSIIYAHELRAVFFMPSLAYSIKENWDIDFIGQIFMGYQNDKINSLGNVFLLRLTHSY